MTTYYLNNSSGSNANNGTTSGTPWKTMAYANAHIVPGDTVLMQTATWSEQVQITVANTTWKAQMGYTPVIDGGYHAGLFANGRMPPPNNYAPGGRYEGMVNVIAERVTLDGLIVQNIAGKGILVRADYVTVRNCATYHTYSTGVGFHGDSPNRKIRGGVMENCRVTLGCILIFDPDRVNDNGNDNTDQGVRIDDCIDTVVRRCTIGYIYGEGCDVGKGNIRAIVEDCTFINCRHVMLYGMWSTDTIFRRNLLAWASNITGEFVSGDGASHAGIMIRDESTKKTGYTLQNGVQIYDNIVVNMKAGIKIDGSGRHDTALRRGYIGYNTVVSGPQSGVPLVVSQNDTRVHEGIIENNIFDATFAPAGKAVAQGNPTRIMFRNNLWSQGPPGAFSGPGDIIGSAKLANAGRAIVGYMPTGPWTPTALWDVSAHQYDLTDQSARAVDRALKNGATAYNTIPPAMPRDYYNALRDETPDIGAVEFGGDLTEQNGVEADFTMFPSSGAPPLSVTFTDRSVGVGAAVINAWEWDFGDGGTSTSANPIHNYATAGTFSPSLTVRDTVLSLVDTRIGGPVTVSSLDGVTADFTRTPANGIAPMEVTFTDASVAHGAATISTWEWAFGDGEASAATNPVHIYATGGTYTPRLTVRDLGRGLTHQVTKLPVTVLSGNAIAASFSAAPMSGVEPLSVAFTDESIQSGTAVVNEWVWDFGDGQSSAVQNPTHVYATAGRYVPQLTARATALGLVSTFVGEPIIVRVMVSAPGNDVVLKVTRAALATVDGEQTFTAAALSGLTPKSAIFILTRATADGTAADGELLGYGMTAGPGQQVAASVATAHGAATTNAGRMFVTDACLLAVDANGAEILRGTFVEWVPGGVTLDLDWTGTPAAYLLTVRLAGGGEYEAWVGSAAMGKQNSLTDVTGPGFWPDVVRMVATWGESGNALADATISLGLAHKDGTQYCVERTYTDAEPDGRNLMRLESDRIGTTRYTASGRAGAKAVAWDGSGFSLRVLGGDIGAVGLLMAEKFGAAGSRVALVASHTATAVKDYSTTFDPQYVEHLLSQLTAVSSSSDAAKAGTIGVHMAAAEAEFSNLVSGENGSATTNEQSVSDNQVLVVGHTGTTVAAGATTLGAGKYSINYATAPGVALAWPGLAVALGTLSGGSAVAAQFIAVPQSGIVPLEVQFIDLSGSALPLTSWLWDFGDGITSTEQHPLHTYGTTGVFTVTLTVGEGTASDEERKLGYITVDDDPTTSKHIVVIGPLRGRTVTDTSQTFTHDDARGDTPGWIDIGLELATLPLADDPNAPTAESGKVRLYYDPNTGNLKIVRADGTTGTITVS